MCLRARLLKKACMDLDEMLHVNRCRDMDELMNFSTRSRLVRMLEPDCFLRYRMRCNAKFYYARKIPPIGGLQRCMVLQWFLFTLSRRNNFVNMTTNCCSPPNCNTLSDVEWCTYNANFLKIPRWFMALLPMLRVTHIMPVLVLLSVVTGGGRNATLHDLKPYI